MGSFLVNGNSVLGGVAADSGSVGVGSVGSVDVSTVGSGIGWCLWKTEASA